MLPEIAVGKPLPLHAHYQADRLARSFWRMSYRTGRDYVGGDDEAGRPVIVRHEAEGDAAYARRLRTSSPRNYCGPIIRQYNSFVFRKPAAIPSELDPIYEMMVSDVDGRGTSAEKWMRKRLMCAQVDREAYILADTTADPGDIERSLAQAQASGIRPILRAIDADDVIWWHREDGVLVAAVYLFMRNGQQIGRLLTAQTFIEFGVKRESGGTSPIVAWINEEMPHGYGMLPLIDLRPQFDDFDDASGESQIAPLAYAQKKIANLLSLESEELYNNTYTQWVLSANAEPAAATAGAEGDGKGKRRDKIVFGAKRLITVPAGASVSRIGSDVAQAQSIRAAITEEERALYRAAGISAADPLRGTGQAESGVAKAFRFNDLSSTLAALADATEYAWNQAMRIVYSGQGLAYPGDAVYPDDFTLPEFETELISMLDAIARPSMPGVIKRKVVDRFINRNLTDLSEAELIELEIELESQNQITRLPFPGMAS